MRSVLPNFMEMIRAVSLSYLVKSRRYAGDMKTCVHSKGYSTWHVSVCVYWSLFVPNETTKYQY